MAAHPRQSAKLKHCKRCGGHVDEVGQLSWIGQCMGCAADRLTENIHGISTRTGPAFERWKSGMLRSIQNL